MPPASASTSTSVVASHASVPSDSGVAVGIVYAETVTRSMGGLPRMPDVGDWGRVGAWVGMGMCAFYVGIGQGMRAVVGQANGHQSGELA